MFENDIILRGIIFTHSGVKIITTDVRKSVYSARRRRGEGKKWEKEESFKSTGRSRSDCVRRVAPSAAPRRAAPRRVSLPGPFRFRMQNRSSARP